MKTIKRTKGMPLFINWIGIEPEFGSNKLIAVGYNKKPAKKDSSVLWYRASDDNFDCVRLHWPQRGYKPGQLIKVV